MVDSTNSCFVAECFCQFEGRAESVREVAERAEIPFERILATAHSPWQLAQNAADK